MAKVKQIANYKGGWQTPIDIGADAKNVDIEDTDNLITATNVEGALAELKKDINGGTYNFSVSEGKLKIGLKQ